MSIQSIILSSIMYIKRYIVFSICISSDIYFESIQSNALPYANYILYYIHHLLLVFTVICHLLNQRNCSECKNATYQCLNLPMQITFDTVYRVRIYLCELHSILYTSIASGIHNTIVIWSIALPKQSFWMQIMPPISAQIYSTYAKYIRYCIQCSKLPMQITFDIVYINWYWYSQQYQHLLNHKDGVWLRTKMICLGNVVVPSAVLGRPFLAGSIRKQATVCEDPCRQGPGHYSPCRLVFYLATRYSSQLMM
jgi:hypothetical protein